MLFTIPMVQKDIKLSSVIWAKLSINSRVQWYLEWGMGFESIDY